MAEPPLAAVTAMRTSAEWHDRTLLRCLQADARFRGNGL